MAQAVAISVKATIVLELAAKNLPSNSSHFFEVLRICHLRLMYGMLIILEPVANNIREIETLDLFAFSTNFIN